jgi:hypothetical protein
MSQCRPFHNIFKAYIHEKASHILRLANPRHQPPIPIIGQIRGGYSCADEQLVLNAGLLPRDMVNVKKNGIPAFVTRDLHTPCGKSDVTPVFTRCLSRAANKMEVLA